MKCLLLTPLIFCITTPHYLVISFHNDYSSLKHINGPLNLVWPVITIFLGIILSAVLLKFLLGTFTILIIGTFIFILCCASLVIGSMGDSKSLHSYAYIILIGGIAIGMSQPNIAAIFGDQSTTNRKQYFYVYGLIHMIGIGLAAAAPLSKKFRTPKISCGKWDCYSLVYMGCLLLSCLAFVLLILLYFLRSMFVIRPLFQHKPFDATSTKRLKVFLSILIPLINIFVACFLIDNEWFAQAKHMNCVIIKNFFVHDYHLQAIYSIITVLCVPLAMLLAVRQPNGFTKITLGCILISLSSYYMQQIETYVKDSYYTPPVIESGHVALHIFNTHHEVEFYFRKMNITVPIPLLESTGRLTFASQESLVVIDVHFFLQEKYPTYMYETISIVLPPVNENATGKCMGYMYGIHGKVISYEERTHRVATGLVLLRVVCGMNMIRTVCIQSKTFETCFKVGGALLMEIPADMYTFTYPGKSTILGTYFLDYGGYYTLLLFQNPNLNQRDHYAAYTSLISDYFGSTFTIIPSYKLSVRWNFLLFFLLSLAKVMIYAAGLDVSYLIATDHQKSLFIGCLHSFYLIAFIGYRIIDTIYTVEIIDSMDLITAVSAMSTIGFYGGHRCWSHLLNRKE